MSGVQEVCGLVILCIGRWSLRCGSEVQWRPRWDRRGQWRVGRGRFWVGAEPVSRLAVACVPGPATKEPLADLAEHGAGEAPATASSDPDCDSSEWSDGCPTVRLQLL